MRARRARGGALVFGGRRASEIAQRVRRLGRRALVVASATSFFSCASAAPRFTFRRRPPPFAARARAARPCRTAPPLQQRRVARLLVRLQLPRASVRPRYGAAARRAAAARSCSRPRSTRAVVRDSPRAAEIARRRARLAAARAACGRPRAPERHALRNVAVLRGRRRASGCRPLRAARAAVADAAARGRSRDARHAVRQPPYNASAVVDAAAPLVDALLGVSDTTHARRRGRAGGAHHGRPAHRRAKPPWRGRRARLVGGARALRRGLARAPPRADPAASAAFAATRARVRSGEVTYALNVQLPLHAVRAARMGRRRAARRRTRRSSASGSWAAPAGAVAAACAPHVDAAVRN